jgi:diguanylate cyclase (GGDEF)-like protein
MRAVHRLLEAAATAEGPAEVEDRLVDEARRVFQVTRAALVPVDEAAPGELLVPLHGHGGAAKALMLADDRGRDFSEEELDVARTLAAAAASGLARLELAQGRAGETARQAALSRAAKSLSASLDMNRVLVRICEESARILDADIAVVYLGDGSDGLRVEAAFGLGPEAIGLRLEPGQGLAGRVAQRGEPMLTNDYRSLSGTPAMFAGFHSAMAVPMHWQGQLRGVLSLGWTRPGVLDRHQLSLLSGFGEMAAAACRNASVHEGLALAARTDALTGCLNHAALHDALRVELERCRRTGHCLSLTIVDLDDFKQVNERYGHLVGDEVLRRVGHGLRQAVRPYDLVGRYGGDEFAIVSLDSEEAEAGEVAARAIERVARSVEELDVPEGPGKATGGVAEWQPSESATELIARADRALLYGKQAGARGRAVRASTVPEDFHPKGSERPIFVRAREGAEDALWAERQAEQTKRLRKRTRQLMLANALGTRLAAMTTPQDILDAAVEELHRAFGYYVCAIVRIRDDGYVETAAGRGRPFARTGEGRRWSQPLSAGLIGRCLRERRPVVSGEVHSEPDYTATATTRSVQSELVAPLWVGHELWGAINVEEVRPRAFDDDDARLVQTIADQVGSALRSATLYQRLDRAYLGTAEALAAALEAKDSYTAQHSRSVVEHAEAVGGALGMSDEELRNLRFGAIFHDIGKIAIPEAILHKRGPLAAHERQEIERHPVIGERILAPIEFLADVRPLVRHEHERWDGGGYPDGLAGEDIPLGSRIILACDAYDAMTSDRPYRGAMSPSEARAELRMGAGTQFDPRVVDALLDVIACEDQQPRRQAALSEPR